ncbi:hypothetical protein XI09_12350 [Bradyrhizobium sp. CCBAU 11386]|nr:hypothetical protein [Bradyrhizobium sp. CCBAU 11386]
MGILEQVDWMPNYGGSNPYRLQFEHRLICITAARPGFDGVLDVVVNATAGFCRIKRRVYGPVWSTNKTGKPLPHLVVGGGYYKPVILARASKAAVRHELRMSIAVPFRRHRVDRVDSEPWRRKWQHAFDLGEVSKLPLPGITGTNQRDQNCDAAVQAADSLSEGNIAHHGRKVGLSDYARQARALFESRAVRTTIAINTIRTKRGHRQLNPLRVERSERITTWSELRQDIY